MKKPENSWKYDYRKLRNLEKAIEAIVADESISYNPMHLRLD